MNEYNNINVEKNLNIVIQFNSNHNSSFFFQTCQRSFFRRRRIKLDSLLNKNNNNKRIKMNGILLLLYLDY